MNERKVLIIDDDKSFVDIVRGLLESHGYKVDAVNNGSEGLRKIRQKPDLLLLDRSLPDIEGLEICQNVRNDKELCRIPIIILSARDRISEQVEGLKIGADDYVTKPFKGEDLLARIEALLRRTRIVNQTDNEIKELKKELRQIIQNKSITPLFQPIFSTKSLKPLGLEVRSRPPITSPLSSTEFLFKVAHTLGMYDELERLCWIRAIARWRESVNKGKLFLHCNPQFIEDDQLGSMFFSSQSISPQEVTLEIGSSLFIQDENQFVKKINACKQWGIKIVINDVGSGGANLDTVVKLKPNFIKIDLVLVKGIHADPLKRSIVSSIVDFCKKQEIQTIAEGIEQADDFRVISSLGVDALQGNLLARPNKEIDSIVLTKLAI